MLYFDLSPFTQSVCIKVIYSWNFRCSWKKAVLLLLLLGTLHVAISKCIVSWFYFLYFNLPLLTESEYVKFNFSWVCRGSKKEAGILLLSWSTLYRTFSKWKVSWFWLFYFDLSLFTQSACIKCIFYCGLFLPILVQHQLFKFHILYSFTLEIFLPPSKRKPCNFSHGLPCALYFQGIVCPELFLDFNLPLPKFHV